MLESVLIANRGEIAVRIARTLRRLGVRAIAVHSDADAGAPHVRAADAAVRIGPAAAARSYLAVEHLLDAAAATGAQAVHPGYGFLSESAAFARAVQEAGLLWIGPPAAAIEAMGDKIRAKQAVEAADVPVVPGVHEPGMDDAALLAAASSVGFPLMVKAAAGGGGKGMRVVRDPDALPAAIGAARREALGAFGDDDLLLERYVTAPRHIEIQVLRDTHGTGLALGERECSLQRRHQKIVEEAPSPLLEPAIRERMAAAAVAAADACDYEGAGTVELIVSGERPDDFFFLEMNTRLQVEHPVTELVWGVDLVEWQLRIAAGEPIDALRDATPRGHAVEARVYAEDPARGFLPTGGRVLAAHQDAAGARVDTGVAAGSVVGSEYDPMLAKVIVHAEDRVAALRGLDAALADYHLLGVPTNVAFLRALLQHPDVVAGVLDTGLVERELDGLVSEAAGDPEVPLLAVAALRLLAADPAPGAVVDPFDLPGGWRVGEPAGLRIDLEIVGGGGGHVEARGRAGDARVRLDDGPVRRVRAERDGADLLLGVDGRVRRVVAVEDGELTWVGHRGRTWALRERTRLRGGAGGAEGAGGPLVAPMPGTVTVVSVTEGEDVEAGQTLLVVEAMKMEHPITAPVAGTVAALHVRAGEQVGMEQALVVVEPAGDDAGEAS
jgi:acetyl-CoA/propionyl-CoA carboxylase, biotin carboxylase, biotin carboxyl carrier protein